MSQSSHEPVSTLVAELRSGNRRALALALSLVESTSVNDGTRKTELLETLGATPYAGSRRIGITGSPGVGKSTLLESFGLQEIQRGRKVAVLAVDPSSTRTGGSILGDQLRMQHLAQHPQAFVRPSPSRLTLGGTTAATRDAIVVCEAAGYDTVLVETVGVGQSEIEVVNMVDLFVLLVLPTAGDDVQGIKRGIMEVADVVVLTKSDLSDVATKRAMAMYLSALGLLLPSREQWKTPVVPVSAPIGKGLKDLAGVIDSYFADDRSNLLAVERTRQLVAWFDTKLRGSMYSALISNTDVEQLINNFRTMVEQGTISPTIAVDSIVRRLSLSIEQE